MEIITEILKDLLKDNDSIAVHRYNSDRYIHIISKESNNTIFTIELVGTVLLFESEDDLIYKFDMADPAFINKLQEIFILKEHQNV